MPPRVLTALDAPVVLDAGVPLILMALLGLFVSGLLGLPCRRKRAEERLRESEERFRSAFDHAPIGKALLTPEGRWLAVNDALCRLVGFSEAELLEMTLDGLTHPDDLVRYHAYLKLMRAGEFDTFQMEKRYRHRQGHYVWVLLSFSAIREAQGGIDHFIAQILNITDRKRAEENLRQTRDDLWEKTLILNTVLSTTSDHIYLLDTHKRYRYASRAAAELLDLPIEALIGKTWRDLGLPAEAMEPLEAEIDQVLASGRSLTDERPYPAKDGLRYFEYILNPVRDEHGAVTGAVVSARDITERKEAEAAIHRLNAELAARVEARTAELRAANEELEAFAYSVSHDLRSPLRAIVGFSRILLADHADGFNPKGRHYLDKVRSNTLRMGELIDGLLQFSRLSRQPLERRWVQPAELVRQALDELSTLREGRQVEIRVDALPPCEADPLLLKQVFVNLLSNALKFTGHRAVARIEVGAALEGHRPVYFVRDNGIGFDMAYADKLFGVFQRLHRAEDYEGTGVGMAIVQRIIHRHGGVIRAEAAPDRGAAFFFTLAGPSNQDATTT